MRRETRLSEMRNLVRRLHALSTPGDPECGIGDEHREAVRLYVQTWCLPIAKREFERQESARRKRLARIRRGAVPR